MRLGGPILEQCPDPATWIRALKALGYRAAYAPVDHKADYALAWKYEQAAREADIIIAEVGAWSNPMAPDDEEAKRAREFCRLQLDLADRIGARCCVNISGSRGTPWDGPDPRNLTDETFNMIVEVVRGIVDAVKPTRSFFTLETMQWMYPDSPDSYLRLLKAIDRKGFAVHLDPVNLVNSPERYYGNAALIQESFRLLGPHIKSCHAKDILLATRATVHLDEIRPGLGNLDYAVYLSELAKLDGDIPIMLEHLTNAEDYLQAANHVREVAKGLSLAL